jgi:cell division protein FtsB
MAAHPELGNTALSMLELIRSCGEAARASWLQCQTALACQEQLFDNLLAVRQDLQKQAETLQSPGANHLSLTGEAATIDELARVSKEIARLKEANAALIAQLARWKNAGEPDGWREFIETAANSGCGVANGVTIASLARKLLVSTENSRKVVQGGSLGTDELM